MAMEHDLKPHLDTWHSFIRIAYYGASFVILVLALMAIFLL